MFPFLVHVDGCGVGEGDAVGGIQVPEAHVAGADAEVGGDDGAVTDFPDEVVVGCVPEPCLQDVADAEALAEVAAGGKRG